MAKINEKNQKKMSGVKKHKLKQINLEQTKQHLLKAVKNDELKEKRKSKKHVEAEDASVLDRFKKKPKK